MCSGVMFAPANNTFTGGERTSFRNRNAMRLVPGLLHRAHYHPSQSVSMCSLNKPCIFRSKDFISDPLLKPTGFNCICPNSLCKFNPLRYQLSRFKCSERNTFSKKKLISQQDSLAYKALQNKKLRGKKNPKKTPQKNQTNFNFCSFQPYVKSIVLLWN